MENIIDFKTLKLTLVDKKGKTIRSTSISRNKVFLIIDDDYWEEFMHYFLEKDGL